MSLHPDYERFKHKFLEIIDAAQNRKRGMTTQDQLRHVEHLAREEFKAILETQS